jgi:hypothetical protein
MTSDNRPTRPSLNEISTDQFVSAWRMLVGEPPAAMLDDRRKMIEILVESVPTLEPSHLAEMIHARRARMKGADTMGDLRTRIVAGRKDASRVRRSPRQPRSDARDASLGHLPMPDGSDIQPSGVRY